MSAIQVFSIIIVIFRFQEAVRILHLTREKEIISTDLRLDLIAVAEEKFVLIIGVKNAAIRQAIDMLC
ncbi:hypothetical protein BGX38DRAFT_654685 [Terfezia claveryi]|nr:hypothetical protein BGX38DRAFT_654685 [Terfezia claveryi]